MGGVLSPSCASSVARNETDFCIGAPALRPIFLFAFSSYMPRVRQQDSFKAATQDEYDLRAPIMLLRNAAFSKQIVTSPEIFEKSSPSELKEDGI
jgi:hypothetical protein